MTEASPFRLHAGLPALGGAEVLDTFASMLRSGSKIDPIYMADSLSGVAREVRRSISALDRQAVAAGRAALAATQREGERS